MSIPLAQKLAVAAYVSGKRLRGIERYALVLQLEPLYFCNLACAGCGKIQHTDDILARRLSVTNASPPLSSARRRSSLSLAVSRSFTGKFTRLLSALVERRRFVYLCTNAILMQRKLDLFQPSQYFAWSVHIDGLRERHDQSVCRTGIFDKAVEAVREAKRRGFRVTTNSTFFGQDDARSIRDVLDYLNDELEVDEMQIAPGFAYEKAPDQEHFLGVERTRAIFREAFAGGRRKRWRLNHSPMYLDFLEGKVDFACTAWGIPSYSVLGWQRPCYLMSSEPYAKSYKELIGETDWSKYGRGRHPKCENCMAHCGYEPTAVNMTMGSPKEMLRAALAR